MIPDRTEALKRAIDAELLMAHLTRTDLGGLLGVDDATLGRRLRGTQSLTVEHLHEIAAALDTTPQALLDRADEVMGKAARRMTARDGSAQIAGDVKGSGGAVVLGNVVGDVTLEYPDAAERPDAQ